MTRLIIVGGFLGAGKTTTLNAISSRLLAEGKKVGLITNDQAAELVDTVMLQRDGRIIKEVSGSCFCCNFPGLQSAVDELIDSGADIILAEPVGSCTDLSATILQPVKEMLAKQVELAPLSVLVDPVRLRAIIDGETGGLAVSAAYIVRKQLEEADIIAINKRDILSPEEAEKLQQDAAGMFPQADIISFSAQEGTGLSEWLAKVLSTTVVGGHLTDVDYDIYAAGEAVLGWLNVTLELKTAGKEMAWKPFVTNYLKALAGTFADKGAGIGHVKLLLENGSGQVLANLTGAGAPLSVRGDDFQGDAVRLIVNARVEMAPGELKELVMGGLTSVCDSNGIEKNVLALNCLQPGRPNPTYRYDKVFVA